MDKTKITSKTYDVIARKFDKTYCKNIYFKKELDIFIKSLKKGSKILDAGCGTGHVAKYLSNLGFKVVGIDLSKEMISIAKKKTKKATFKIMDLRDLKFKKHSFDAIITLFALIHINKKECILTLKNIHSLLKPGGFLFIGLIEGDGDEFVKEPLNKSKKIYFNYYNKSWITKELTKFNFKIIKIKDRVFKDKYKSHNEFFVYLKK